MKKSQNRKPLQTYRVPHTQEYTQTRLLEARELLRLHQIDEAKLILSDLDNPTAKRLLSQIAEYERRRHRKVVAYERRRYWNGIIFELKSALKTLLIAIFVVICVILAVAFLLLGGFGGMTCNDGWVSHAAHTQGACSHHGGIR